LGKGKVQDMFEDRGDAARQLAEHLEKYKDTDTVVLGIPRGGVPIAYHIAEALHLPMDVIFTKKLGHPDNPEMAIGAISLESAAVSRQFRVSEEFIQAEIERIRKELRRRRETYTADKERIPLHGKRVLLTDDGVATGSTMLATIGLLRKARAAAVTVAVPVSSVKARKLLEQYVDEFISLMTPEDFRAVGRYYKNYQQLSDEAVVDLLRKSHH
jgi:predicted phosphoribosyltransferase